MVHVPVRKLFSIPSLSKFREDMICGVFLNRLAAGRQVLWLLWQVLSINVINPEEKASKSCPRLYLVGGLNLPL